MIPFEFKHEALSRALEQYAQKLHAVAQQALVDATDAAQASARATIRSTTHRRTGSLEDSWGTSWLGPYRRRLVNFSDHADYIDRGTGIHGPSGQPYLIHGNPTLRFVVAGTVYFRRWVLHPGIKARPFKALAYAAGQMAMRQSAQAGLDRIAREL